MSATKQALISVIVPIYGVEQYLDKCINSILDQSYINLEIILVDDGSPDQCGAICDTYSEIDDRVRVIHKKNGGVSSARNCGLEAVTGDYIFFVDSDDTLKNNAIEVLFQTAQKTNADITICSCKHIKEKNKGNANCDAEQGHLKTVESSEAIKKLSHNVHVFEGLEPTAVWGKLYKRAVVQNLRFNENMNIGEDFIFNYFANCNSKVVTYCNFKLYNYNFVETSLMNNKTYSPKLMQSFEELVKFEKAQRDTEYSNDVIVRCVNIAFTIYLKIPTQKRNDLKKIEDYIRENRGNVLTNKSTTRKIKIASIMSYISFNLVRYLFNIINIR